MLAPRRLSGTRRARLASRVPRQDSQPTGNTAGGAEDGDREWKQQLLQPRQTNLQSQRAGLEEERTGGVEEEE